MDLYAYIYRYDYLDRLVYKKLPGCSPSYLVYDAAHRLVFSQDGCQRNDSLWSFFVYDVYGRVVVEGDCSNSDKHVRTAGETVVLGTLMELSLIHILFKLFTAIEIAIEISCGF